MKISKNSQCPCGSKLKYKKCCQIYHNGALAKDALTLMKSRYSAYATNNANYIIKTTHPNNSDYTEDKLKWKQEIEAFSKSTSFEKLEILEYTPGEQEAFVKFRATLSGSFMVEKSRFLKIKNQWLYVDGKFE